MELQVSIRGEEALVWQPDTLTLEAMGFTRDEHNPFHWMDHPQKQDCIILIERLAHFDGSMVFSESWKADWKPRTAQNPDGTKALVLEREAAKDLCKFRGWCYSKDDFLTVLRLLRWTLPTTV
jgi:hypothetical protein